MCIRDRFCTTWWLVAKSLFRTSTQYNRQRQRQNPYQKATSSKDFRQLRIFSRCRDCWRHLAKSRAFVAFGKALFFFWQNGAISFFFEPVFFLFFTQGLFSAFDFSTIIVSVKSFHVGILSNTWCKWKICKWHEIRAMSVCRENFARGHARSQAYDTFAVN